MVGKTDPSFSKERLLRLQPTKHFTYLTFTRLLIATAQPCFHISIFSLSALFV